MHAFKSAFEAQSYIQPRVDVPVATVSEQVNETTLFESRCYQIDDNRFTNIYTASFPAHASSTSVYTTDSLRSVYDHLSLYPEQSAAISGGFFFLADQYGGLPRQLALNLAIQDSHIQSLPVADREAVLIKNGNVSAGLVRALGTVTINGQEMSWSGSLTDHETDTKLYGNGNSRITHVQCDMNGTVRILDESSRYTPLMQTSGSVDVGFVSVEDGAYVGIATSQSGELDIFGHDMVLRCPKSSIQTTGLPIARIETIDDQTIGSDLQGALSVGPLVRDSGYDDHPLNADASLGSKPPFSNRPLARTLLFETTDSRVHMQLMDGRPGSAAFSGVTPTEATDIILEENDITWGCFLDPGQTAKLCIQDESGIRSFGNHHYLKWPARSGQSYLWSPQHGRPTASILGVE